MAHNMKWYKYIQQLREIFLKLGYELLQAVIQAWCYGGIH